MKQQLESVRKYKKNSRSRIARPIKWGAAIPTHPISGCALNIPADSQRGVSIIEILVAISLMGIVIVSSSNLIITSMHANTAARTYSSVISDVQQIVDSYRGQGFAALLDKFGTTYSSIANGQSVVETSTSNRSHATYSVTLTAIKSASDANPEAIQVQVSALHRRGKFGDSEYLFHTLISQSS